MIKVATISLFIELLFVSSICSSIRRAYSYLDTTRVLDCYSQIGDCLSSQEESKFVNIPFWQYKSHCQSDESRELCDELSTLDKQSRP